MKVLKFLEGHFEEMICACMMGYLALSLNIEIFARYVLNSPTAVTDEVARILMIGIVFLGTSLAVRTKSHVVIDLLADLPKKSSLMVSIASHLIFMVFSGMMVIASLQTVGFHKMLKTSTDGLGLPFWVLLSVIPFSFLLTILRLIQSIVECLGQHKEESPSKGGRP